MINFAHLHPVLVHLPIGILILACFFHFFSGKFFSEIITAQIVRVCLAAGILSSIPVLVTGILQACQSQRSFEDIFLHLLFAILSIGISMLLYFMYSRSFIKKTLINHVSVILLFVSIALTGHFGGSLTHGEGYLTTFPSDPENSASQTPAKPTSSLHVVEIKQMKFIPNVVIVNPGDTVQFINNDFVPHNAVEIGTGRWTSPKLHPGESWKLVVDAGADYYCSYHVVMKGQIKVADHGH